MCYYELRGLVGRLVGLLGLVGLVRLVGLAGLVGLMGLVGLVGLAGFPLGFGSILAWHPSIPGLFSMSPSMES